MARRRQRFLASVQGFSVVMLGGCLLTLLIGAVCVLIYNPEASEIGGLPPSIAEVVIASYVPIVLTTFLGFRNVAFDAFVQVGGKPQKLIPITQGAMFLYVFASLGFIVAIGGLVLASFTPMKELQAKLVLGAGASLWGITIGAVFNRFFRQYGASSDDTQGADTPS